MKVYKVPLRLEPQPEGGFTVTSPAVQGLVTEGNTVAEALAHAAEALDLVLEDYDAEGTPLPDALRQEVQVIEIDYPVVRP
jgi:antitoxin HicB